MKSFIEWSVESLQNWKNFNIFWVHSKEEKWRQSREQIWFHHPFIQEKKVGKSWTTWFRERWFNNVDAVKNYRGEFFVFCHSYGHWTLPSIYPFFIGHFLAIPLGCPILQEVPESWLLGARLRTFSKLFLNLASFFWL